MHALVIALVGLGDAGIPLVVFAVTVWLSLVWWTFTDVRRRTRDGRTIWGSVALVLVPVLGIVVYLILRPPEYLEDAYEREVSIAASEKLIGVLTELQETQREIQGSVQRLEQALQASRRRAAAQGSPPRSASTPSSAASEPRSGEPTT